MREDIREVLLIVKLRGSAASRYSGEIPTVHSRGSSRVECNAYGVVDELSFPVASPIDGMSVG
jgi:hypothetical protein